MKELEAIKGRHTELVSVYIPSGYSLVDIINQLNNEKSTAMNIKSKTTRKNVLTALEKIIGHIRIFKQTPPNGLVVFCGNVSPEEGKEDIRIWSLEPPEKMETKIYWCDQVFVLEPLKEMVKEKEVFGLLVLDARDAEIGLLIGKKIKSLKHLESTVPSKTVKGGMCVEGDTLIQLQDGNIIPIKELSTDKKILSYSFDNFKQIFTNSFELFKRKADKSYELVLQEPSNSLILTPEHKVFVVGENGIEEKTVEEINTGDMLLSISNLQIKNRDEPSIDKNLSQLLGYILGGGTVDNDKIILCDKDVQLLKVYKRIAESLLKEKPTILKRRNFYELRLHKKSLVDFVLSNFPEISKPRRIRDIDSQLLVLPKKKLSYFIRGLFDAGAYVDRAGICLRMTNRNVAKKIQLVLMRYNIVASVTDKPGRYYKLQITHPIYIKNFKQEIGFSSLEKMKRLNSIVKKHRRNLGYAPFKKMIQEFKKKFKNKKTLGLLNKIYNSGIVPTIVKEKRELRSSKEFYDLYVPKLNSFVANGIIVHNSQARYDRLREDAINEFLTKVGEIASKLFLDQPELKGIIVGGPGPIKDQFVRENYLHYQLQSKVLGVKDVGYTDEYGLEQLVKRSQDLLQEAAVMKERQLLEKFFTELQKGGNVVYGFTETIKALNLGAVDTLLISEDFDWVRIRLRCESGHTSERDLPKTAAEQVQLCEECGREMKVEGQEDLTEILTGKAKEYGSKIEIISTDITEGKQFKELGGIGGFLRYRV